MTTRMHAIDLDRPKLVAVLANELRFVVEPSQRFRCGFAKLGGRGCGCGCLGLCGGTLSDHFGEQHQDLLF